MRRQVPFLEPGTPLPDPRAAGRAGLVAVGGDLRPGTLLDAYSKGIFPWYDREPVLWHSPDPRMVLLPSDLRVSRSLRRTIKRGTFDVRLDTVFERVIRSCAEVPRRGERGTWITPAMIEAYCRLHDMGYAHSAESYRDGALAGGLYGVSLGAAFFAESMFTREDDASKVALVALVTQIRAWGFQIFDCQVHTDHAARFGATEWPRDRFLRALATALREPGRRGRWAREAGGGMPAPREAGD